MRLSRDRIASELKKADGWRLRGSSISRQFTFDDFMAGIRFVNRVARVVEAMNHHPDIIIKYNKLRFNLTTHDEGGLTMRDFRLARRINNLLRG